MKYVPILKRRFFAVIITAGLLCWACSSDDAVYPDQNGGGQVVTDWADGWEEPVIPADPGDPGDDELVPNSQSVNYDNQITVAFSDSGVTVTNPFEGAGVSVNIDGQHVVLESTITGTELTYVLQGIATDGSVKIYGEYKFNLVLNGVGITNPDGAAINIQCGKKGSVILQDGTNNRLTDGEEYIFFGDEKMKGTFYSRGQLVFSGTVPSRYVEKTNTVFVPTII